MFSPRRQTPTSTGSTPGDELRILEVDEFHALATWRNMLLLVWRRETTPAAVQRATLTLSRLALAHKQGLGLMQIAEVTAKAPDTNARTALAKLLASGQDSVKCSSLIYAGTGFWMAAARAFVTGLTMLSRPKFPHVVFATIQEAADWHARLLPLTGDKRVSSREMVATVSQLTNALDSLTWAASKDPPSLDAG